MSLVRAALLTLFLFIRIFLTIILSTSLIKFLLLWFTYLVDNFLNTLVFIIIISLFDLTIRFRPSRLRRLIFSGHWHQLLLSDLIVLTLLPFVVISIIDDLFGSGFGNVDELGSELEHSSFKVSFGNWFRHVVIIFFKHLFISFS